MCRTKSVSLGSLIMNRLMNESTSFVHCHDTQSMCADLPEPFPALIISSGDGRFTSHQMRSIERHIATRRVGCDSLGVCATLTTNAFQLHHGFEHAPSNERELSTRDDSDDENGNAKSDDSNSAMNYDDPVPSRFRESYRSMNVPRAVCALQLISKGAGPDSYRSVLKAE